MTKTQIDRLGARLRSGDVSDADLRLLDEYRESFAGAYDHVMRRLRTDFELAPTGRAAKSTFAITGKLRRESVRLSQIQDIAGCRVVVTDVPAQDRVATSLAAALNPASVVDRRERPSHGYRAVHLVLLVEGRAVEVQVRTAAQQLWAEISERLSDRFGVDVKYGRGGDVVRDILNPASHAVGQIGHAEAFVSDLRARAETSPEPFALRSRIEDIERTLDSARAHLRLTLTFAGGSP